MDATWSVAMFSAGVVASVCGYFFVRWFEGRSFRERLQEHVDLATLKQQLDEGVTLASLAELKDQLKLRRKVQAQNESEFLETIGIEARNQVEMNAQAHHLMDLTQKQLEYLVEVLQLKLSGEEREAFEKVQTAWRAFARRQADFASLIFDSGSMQPMIRAAELRALTVERAGQIKQEIKQRQELFD